MLAMANRTLARRVVDQCVGRAPGNSARVFSSRSTKTTTTTTTTTTNAAKTLKDFVFVWSRTLATVIVLLLVLQRQFVPVTAVVQDPPSEPDKPSHWSADIPGFYHRLHFSGGETEIRSHLRQVTLLENAMETRGTVSRRLSDGQQLLSLFYLDNRLVSCRIESDPVDITEFYRAMVDDFNCAEHKTTRHVKSDLHRATPRRRAGLATQSLTALSSLPSAEDGLRSHLTTTLGRTTTSTRTLELNWSQNRQAASAWSRDKDARKDVPVRDIGDEEESEELLARKTGSNEGRALQSEESPDDDDTPPSKEETVWCPIEDRLSRQVWNETFVLLQQGLQQKELMKKVMSALHFKSHRRACRRLQRHMRRMAAVQRQADEPFGVDEADLIQGGREDVRGDENADDEDENPNNEDVFVGENDRRGVAKDNVISVEEGLDDAQQQYEVDSDDSHPDRRRSRSRRSLFSSIMPSTKWCGSGNEAVSPNDLGSSASTDRCCRQHDRCPYTLVAFQRRWGLRNKSLFTMSHCKCDQRFRSCLKMARTSQSRFVGRLFFDLLSKQCFVFKKVRRCARLSWDGSRCIRNRWAKRAIVRDGMNYY